MLDPYANRQSYRSLVSGDGLSYFRVTVRETDLLIGVASNPSVSDNLINPADLSDPAFWAVEAVRAVIEKQIAKRPEFQTSLEPLEPTGDEPELIASMLSAAQVAGTGPMAAVAGTVAAFVGEELHRRGAEAIVENGGDIFLIGSTPRTVAIVAGDSPISMQLGLQVDPTDGIGVCTSSGTYGHSLSFGKSDAAVVVAHDCALADAVATMLGNKCKNPDDLGPAVEWAAALPGVDGAVAVMGENLAAAGDLQLVRLG